jgi:hypothetical protein
MLFILPYLNDISRVLLLSVLTACYILLLARYPKNIRLQTCRAVSNSAAFTFLFQPNMFYFFRNSNFQCTRSPFLMRLVEGLYSIHRVKVPVPSSELGSPPPPPLASVLPPWTQRGGSNIECGRGVKGVTLFGRLDRKRGPLYSLWCVYSKSSLAC